MNNFINRKKELETLNSLYNSKHSELAVVYGRRRLGKTTLLKEFAQKLPHSYFLADKAGEKLQIKSMSTVMATALNEPLLESLEFNTWYELFEAFDRFRKGMKKFVLIIDEYQYLCQTQPAFSSYIQKWWDEHWKENNLMLIICGSLTSMMYKETMKYTAPLYGRASTHILLSPFNPSYLKDFVSSKSSTELVEFFSMSGGVPRYIELCSKHNNYRDIVMNLFLNKESILYSEAKYLLQEEITSPNTCWSILNAIATGSTKISELGNKLSLPANQLTRYIDLLKDLFLINREVPVLEKNPANSKKGVYAVTDPFMKLWFGCIYPYESFLEFDEKELILEKLFPLIQNHISYCFEELSRVFIKRHMVEYNCIKVGRQWGRDYEIDVAGVNIENKLTVLGECKWSNSKTGISLYEELRRKIDTNKLPVAENVRYFFFSKSGFTDDLKVFSEKGSNIVLIEDLFD